VIMRREPPHPGAELKFTEANGPLPRDAHRPHRRRSRGRASAPRLQAENLIRGAKQTGLENLPFRELALNAVGLELSLIAQDLIAWTQRLDGGLAIREPKGLRYRLLHATGRVSFHPRRAVLPLPAAAFRPVISSPVHVCVARPPTPLTSTGSPEASGLIRARRYVRYAAADACATAALRHPILLSALPAALVFRTA
jgi:hypothetical protein